MSFANFLLCSIKGSIESIEESVVSKGFDWNEVVYLGIGAIIGFVASIGTVFAQRWIERRGKLKIYYEINDDVVPRMKFGIQKCKDKEQNEMLTLFIPMNIEIQNTTDVQKVVRDFGTILCNQGKMVKKTIQAKGLTREYGKTGEKEQKLLGAEKGAYSFVIPPRSIVHENCVFMYKIEDDRKIDFDELRIRYFDECDKKHSYTLCKVENCWKEQEFAGTVDWVLIKD